MDPLAFWEDSTIPSHHKYDNSAGSGSSRAGTPHVKEEQTLYRYCDSVTGNLNFSTVATSEDDEYSYHKKKMSRDPMSHRIIEKRRRDRMNNCLADLSRLIPADYMKKGRGRIEKTEIIEMAIKHMKHLQDHHATCHLGSCEMDHHQSVESEESYSPLENHSTPALVKVCGTPAPLLDSLSVVQPASLQIVEEHYRLGYHECLSETMHFLVEVEGMFAGDKLCVQLISHLQRHCDKILKGGGLNVPRVHTNETTSSSSLGSKERSSGSGSSSDGGDRSGGINGSGDEPYYNSASQLREILTSNHVAGRLKMVQEPPSPPNSINGASSLTENHSSSGSLYKFKNNIKQRFSAEHSEGIEEQSHPLALKRRRSDEHRQGCETSSLSSPPPDKYQQPPSPSPPPPPLPGVPIFALHSKGSFYIPLTVDHHLLAPFLPDLSDVEANLSSVVLHPVTISVNFQQTTVARSRSLKQPLCFTSSSPPPHDWSPATTPHNYLPLPKWATCTPHLN